MITEASTYPDDDLHSLRYEDVRERRNAMLEEAHIAPLTDYVRQMRLLRPNVEIPHFDPLDGGVKAQVLFLLEKPGPMTDPNRSDVKVGSGFISRNNDDPTAEATWKFMDEVGLPRTKTVIWNVTPWWNGTIKVTSAERREGTARIGELVKLLPNLKVIVLVGNQAKLAKPLLDNLGYEIVCSYHPSGRVRSLYPDKWHAIPSECAKAKVYIDANP